MNLYVFDIGEKARKVARFIGEVRAEFQRAFVIEKSFRKITQQQIATMIGVNRSVINRQLMGLENLTLRRVAELAWALGWEIVFQLRKPGQEIRPAIPIQGAQMPHGNPNQLNQSPAPLRVIDNSFSTAA
jgi:hypothetical protein